jgi:hypothetical protein
MIPWSRYYKESIFIHYSYVTFYACSFPHNNIHTYIMYIFRVSSKCSYDSILLYSYIYGIHVKVYCYCLTVNCYCPISNCYCPISNCYCLYIELILSNCYCLTLNYLLSTHWTVTVQPLLSNFELLLSRHLNCYCLHIELLLSNRYYLTLNCYCPIVTI